MDHGVSPSTAMSAPTPSPTAAPAPASFPEYPAFRDALLSGYRARRDVDVRYLDDFIGLRQVAFDLWYTGTAQVNSAFSARLDRVHRWSLAMLDLVETS